MMMSQQDAIARKLEKEEDKLIKRLKDTHVLQQQTLSKIQDIFESPYKPPSSSKQTLKNRKSKKSKDS